MFYDKIDPVYIQNTKNLTPIPQSEIAYQKRCSYDYNQVPTFFTKTYAVLQVGSSKNNNQIA